VSYGQRYLLIGLVGLPLTVGMADYRIGSHRTTRITSDRVWPAASQLVTRSTRHPVNSSHSQLVTKRRSTRHKQTKHQSRTAQQQ